METLGITLKAIRQKRRLTLGQVSLLSGIAKATLSRWESGINLPRMPEMTRFFDALDVPTATRSRCLTLLHAPRAVVAIRQSQDAAMPLSLGDILEGLRWRSGKTQAEVARLCHVSRSLYSQWERDAGQPTASALHAAGYALGATADEMVTLTTRAFAPAPQIESRDDLIAQYQSLFELDADMSPGLYAPKLLSLFAHCGRLVRQNKASTGDFAMLLSDYGSTFFVWEGDDTVTTSIYQQALALAGRSDHPLHMHIATSVSVVLKKEANPRPLRERVDAALAWKDRFATKAGKAYLLSYIAREMATEAPDVALRLADEYCALVEDDEGEYPCRLRDRGNLLKNCDRVAESVAFIASLVPQDAFRAGLRQLELAEGLVTLGSKAEARTCLSQAEAIFAGSPFGFAQKRIEELQVVVS